MIIGSHVGFNKKEQLLGSVREALSYNSTTFMFYTGAPQNTTRLPIDDDLTKQAFELMKENNINPKNVIIHAPYIVNLANEKNFEFSINFLKQEIKRVEQLGFDKVVLHPGSHVGIGPDQALKNITKSSWFNNTNNYVIKIATEKSNTLWEVFSVYHIPTTSDYLQISFNSDEEFLDFANKLKERSYHKFNTNIYKTDKIITLSTCFNDNEKVVMHARLIKIQNKNA